MAIINDYAGVARGLEELRVPEGNDVCVCQRGSGPPPWRTPSPDCPLHAHECRHGPVINPSSLRVVQVTCLSIFDLPEVWLAKIINGMVDAWRETGYMELPEVVEVAPDIYGLLQNVSFGTVPFLRFLVENDLRAVQGVKPALVVRPWSEA